MSHSVLRWDSGPGFTSLLFPGLLFYYRVIFSSGLGPQHRLHNSLRKLSNGFLPMTCQCKHAHITGTNIIKQLGVIRKKTSLWVLSVAWGTQKSQRANVRKTKLVTCPWWVWHKVWAFPNAQTSLEINLNSEE